MPIVLKTLIVLVVVVLGATIFSAFIMPYMLASLYIQKNVAIEQAIVDGVKKSIVAMETPFSIRSGLVLSEDGLVVTLDSILKKRNVISGYMEGDSVSLKNLHMANNNLALLRMSKSGLKNIKFADEANTKAGQKVFLVAAASFDQDEWIVNEGTISQVGGETIVTDIIGNPATSSAPLFNAAGELVGITYLDQSGRTVATSVSKIRTLVGF